MNKIPRLLEPMSFEIDPEGHVAASIALSRELDEILCPMKYKKIAVSVNRIYLLSPQYYIKTFNSYSM